jgi:hypothetical protein
MANTFIPIPDINGTTINQSAATDGSSYYYPALQLALNNAGTPVPVSASNAVPVTSNGYIGTSTVTRAANTTAYTGNGSTTCDVIGGVLTIANVGPNAGQILITSIVIILNITAVPSGVGNLILFLYDATPPSAIADNGAFSVSSGDRANILTPNGINLGTPILAKGGGSVVVQVSNLNLQLKLASASTSLFAYLVTDLGFTPANASETYSLRARAIGV